MLFDHVPAAPGVYAIANTANGKRYVGSSVNMRGRVRAHVARLRRDAHVNDHLSRAWAAFGESSFRIEVLESVADREALTLREQVFIDVLGVASREHGYNASPLADRPFHTAEVRAKMSAAKKGRPGRKLSAVECANLLQANARKRGVPLSDKHRAAISDGMKRSEIKRTPEQIANLTVCRLAQGCSAETRARLSVLAKQQPRRPCGEETRRKISAAQKGRPGRSLSADARAAFIAAGAAARRLKTKAA